jgi:hypothetical protein
MQIRDRVKELRRVLASELLPNPRNWRIHPPAQQDALRGVLAEVGYAGALLARELDDGRLQLIDGHLRAETTPEALVPVLVLDVDEQEAIKILVTHDPLSALAGADVAKLNDALSDCEIRNPALMAMLADLDEQVRQASEAVEEATERAEVDIPESWQVVVECSSEDQQREVFERMIGQGFKCRVLTL